jgi:hypothetical protein
MKYFFITALLLVIVSTHGLTQDMEQDRCQRTSNKRTKEILKSFPFNKAKSIKIVSFKIVDEEAVEYEIPKIDGQVDVSKLFEIKTLNKKNTSKLLDMLVNINYPPLRDIQVEYSIEDSTELIVRDIRVNMCYTPRHAILFENENKQVFSYIEICFECLRYKTEPKNLVIGEFCYEKYTMLEDFFRHAGIVYGIGQNGMNWVE